MLHRLDVPPEIVGDIGPIAEATDEVAVDAGLEKVLVGRQSREGADLLGEDGLSGGFEPLVRIAQRQHHLGVGVMPGQLAPEAAGRIVHRRHIAVEDPLPVGPPARGFEPERRVGRIPEGLAHVIAAPAQQLLQRDLQRCGSGAAEPCPDDLERHEVSPMAGPEIRRP